MSLNATIAELLVQQGQAQGRGVRGSGQAWGSALANIGQDVGQAVAAIPQMQEQAAESAERKRARAARDEFANAMKSVPHVNQEGLSLYDVKGIGAAMDAKGYGPEFAAAAGHLDAINQSMMGFQEARKSVIRTGAQALLASGEEPDEALTNQLLDTLEANQVYAPDTIKQWRGRTSDPSGRKAVLSYLAGPPKLENAAPGSVSKNTMTGEIVPGSQVPDPKGDAAATLATDRAAEVARHNQEVERIAALTAGRAEATAAETARHNQATEAIARTNASTNQTNAATNQKRYTANGVDSEALGPLSTVFERSILSIPATRRAPKVALVNRLAAEGKNDEIKDVIRQAAIEGEPVAQQQQITGRMATMASLRDTRDILNEMKAAGVPTDWITGNAEDLARKLGTTTNPKYVELGNRLQGTLINYRRAATGVAFGEKEAAQYEKMFPNYKNQLPVNLALISGLEREMSTYDRTYWEHKLGKDGAELVGVVPETDLTPPPKIPAGSSVTRTPK